MNDGCGKLSNKYIQVAPQNRTLQNIVINFTVCEMNIQANDNRHCEIVGDILSYWARKKCYHEYERELLIRITYEKRGNLHCMNYTFSFQVN